MDYNEILFVLKKYTPSDDNNDYSELGEQDAAGGGGTTAAAYPTVTKWESGVTRGKANQIANNKWESGVARGKANTLI